MNNVIFADAHEHAIKTVPEMILVYNKQATLLNIVNLAVTYLSIRREWSVRK